MTANHFSNYRLFIPFIFLAALCSSFHGSAQITSATWDGETRTFDSGLSDPQSFAFGRGNLYILDNSTESVYEFDGGSESSPQNYDLPAEDDFLISNQETSSRSIAFNADGDKMYVMGLSSDKISEYRLSTDFDLNTASYLGDNNQFSITQMNSARAIGFNDDGTKLFISGFDISGDPYVYQYSMVTPFDVTGASYDGDSERLLLIDESGINIGANGFAFNNNGHVFWIINETTDRVVEFLLTSPYDISTATVEGSFYVRDQQSRPKDIDFDAANDDFLILGTSGDHIDKYSMNPYPYASSIRLEGNDNPEASGRRIKITFSESVDGVSFGDFTITTSGSVSYTNVKLEQNSGNVYYLDFSGLSGNGTVSASLNSSGTGITEAASTNLQLVGGSDTYTFLVGSAYNALNIKFEKQIVLPTNINEFGLSFKEDGSVVFLLSEADSVLAYGLSTPFDIATFNNTPQKKFYVGNEESDPRSVVFNDDGTKMFIMGSGGADYVFEYDLSIAWDISTASNPYQYDPELNNPRSLNFGNNGLKMYMVTTDEYVHEYTLTTAYDLETATYLGLSERLDVTGPNLNLSGLEFDDTGKLLFLIGTTVENIITYSLSTAWDVSTGTYLGDDLIVQINTEIGDPHEIAFGANGTKFFIIDDDDNKLTQYTLNEAPELLSIELQGEPAQDAEDVFFTFTFSEEVTGTASPDFPLLASSGVTGVPSMRNTGSEITVGVYDIDGNGIFTINLEDIGQAILDNDGEDFVPTSVASGFYQVGNHYNLSNPQLETVFTDIENSPRSFVFGNSGSKLFVAISNFIYEYDLSTAYDVATAVYAGDPERLDTSNEDTQPYSIEFNSDGSKFYLLGITTDDVYEYHLSTNFDISTASHQATFINNDEVDPRSITFNNDGSKMYLTGYSGDDINQYDLTTPFDITSIGSTTNPVVDVVSSPISITFNGDGSIMYILDLSDDVHGYILTTPFDASTAVYAGLLYDTSGDESSPQSIAFNDDGSKFYVMGTSGDDINQYSPFQPLEVKSFVLKENYESQDREVQFELTLNQQLSGLNPFDFEVVGSNTTQGKLSSAGGDPTIVITVRDIFGDGLVGMKLDGDAGLQDAAGNDITSDIFFEVMHPAGASYNLANLTLLPDEVLDISNEETSGTGFCFNDDGTKLFLIGSSTDFIHEYILSTPYDISTATHHDDFDVGDETFIPEDIMFNGDGTAIYILDGADDIAVYNLSTAYDLTGIAYAGADERFAIDEESAAKGFAFGDNGNYLFLFGSVNDMILKYALSTPYDVTTAFFQGTGESLYYGENMPTAAGVAFSPDGYQVFLAGFSDEKLISYSLTSPYDLSTATLDTDQSLPSLSASMQVGDLAFDHDGLKLFILDSDPDEEIFAINLVEDLGDINIWDGQTSTDVTVATNWLGDTIPTTYKHIKIPFLASSFKPVLTTDFVVEDLEIEELSRITVESGASLAILGTFSGDGNVIAKRNVTPDKGYSIIGSPIVDATVEDLSPDFIYGFDGSEYTVPTGTMSPGTGYFAAFDDSSPVITFTGTPNASDVTFDIPTSGEFHLVSNPYTAAVSRSDLATTNSSFDGTIYLWKDGGANIGNLRSGTYIAVNNGDPTPDDFTGNIGSMQGFYVLSSDDSDITFTQSMQAVGTGENADGGYYRVTPNPKLRLELANETFSDKLLITMANEATEGMDAGWDAIKFMNPHHSFYSLMEEEKMAIQALPKDELESELHVAIGFDVVEKGEFKLSVSEMIDFPDGFEVYLKDKLTGRIYLLTDDFEIDVSLMNEVNEDRFSISLKKQVLGADDQVRFNLHGNGNNLWVEYGSNKRERVTIYQVNGSVIFDDFVDFEQNKALLQVNLNPHVLYVLKLNDEVVKFMKK